MKKLSSKHLKLEQTYNGKKTKCEAFKPVFDFDVNGIIYNIATNNDTKKWSNPGLNGEIKISFSTVSTDSYALYYIFEGRNKHINTV